MPTISKQLVRGSIILTAFLIFYLVAPSIARADSMQHTQINFDQKKHTVTLDNGKNNAALPFKSISTPHDSIATADALMNSYGKQLGLSSPNTQKKFIADQTDQLGMHHVRYGQTFNGVPVFGAQTIVHLNSQLQPISINGQTVPDVQINTTPLVSKQMAEHIATVQWSHQGLPLAPTVINNSLQILNTSLIPNNIDNKNHLVWYIELYKQTPTAREYYFIDAQDGRLIYQITGIQQAISRRIYDCSQYLALGCRLDYLYFGYTYGRSEGQAARGTNPVYGGTDTDTLYTILNNTHNYFNATFSRNGANALGGLGDGTSSPTNRTDGYVYLNSVVPDQGCPNAYFDGATVNFCNGLVYTDVVAHEYGHGVGQYAIRDAYGNPSGLIYSGESGALNESLADIFGEAVENYVTGAGNWLIGESINVTGMIGPLRSMSDPASIVGSFSRYPDRFYSPYYYCLAGDGGGVHHNSSVPNHAAYLMTIGGTFNGCSITGIGRAKEEQIFYRAMTTYLTPSSGFNAAYTALNTACADLYGATSSDCINAKKALQSVEMDQAGYCSATPAVTPACSPASLTTVTSSVANGYYNAGDAIDIALTFGNAITGSGTVTFDSGGSCTFSVTSGTSASCTYTVGAGENSADLTVSTVTGSFTNAYGEAVTSLTPGTNLATNKNIAVDTTAPTGTIAINSGATKTTTAAVTLDLYGHDENHVPSMRFSNDNITWSEWEEPRWTKTWTLDSSRGIKTVYVQYMDSAGNVVTVADTISYLKSASVITVPGAGTEPYIKAFTYVGKQQTSVKNLLAFDKAYKEGIHVAACDVDGDGVDEIVSAVGPKQEPWIKVFRQNGQAIARFLAYEKNIKGGVFVACGDLNGDGKGEIVTGVPEGFGPHVRTFNGQTGKPIISMGFFAYAKNVRTGIRVATGDLDNDGIDEIVVGAGTGAGTHVRVFSGAGKLKFTPGFFVYGKTDRTGIKVAVGDTDGDGIGEIITGSGTGRIGEIKIFTRAGTEVKKFSPFGNSYKGGVKISSGDVNADGIDEIICSKEAGGDPVAAIFTAAGKKLGSFQAYTSTLRGGAETAAAHLEK